MSSGRHQLSFAVLTIGIADADPIAQLEPIRVPRERLVMRGMPGRQPLAFTTIGIARSHTDAQQNDPAGSD